jgi:ubiquinone/menaquinone biosynthesis C-methylase UbiE
LSVLSRGHRHLVSPRRVRVLGEHLLALIPSGSSVLDVGCGDGALDAWLQANETDLQIRGVDVFVRPEAAIPVEAFDGRRLPHPDGCFDLVMMVDVLHHAEDALALLREAARVARRGIVIKDHNREGVLAFATLCLMDFVGNAYEGAIQKYRYWSKREWGEVFRSAGLKVLSYRDRLGLYPPPADWLFGRHLHFVALLGKA